MPNNSQHAHLMPDSSQHPYLSVEGLSKSFGSFNALSDITLTINEGEFACFLGPSGCGKTTLLRCIAGLEQQSAGRIHQAQTDISTLPPSGRDFGIVFQSYALFPNLTVYDNVAYGLVNKKWGKQETVARVDELLTMVNLMEHKQKYPSQLSGGEQQRVALSRALATSPGLLLLDEPLSALDAKVRLYLRKQIKELHTRLGVTTIMVTHDQEEAQSMADNIFVMNNGEVVQSGSPREIYRRPNSPFIANFIGITNFIDGQVKSADRVKCASTEVTCAVEGLPVGTGVRLAIRPEFIELVPDDSTDGERLSGIILNNEFLGSYQRLHLSVPALTPETLMVDVSASIASETELKPGQSVNLRLPQDALRAYPDE
jgi:iron(III) transport system ATP-binding protein